MDAIIANEISFLKKYIHEMTGNDIKKDKEYLIKNAISKTLKNHNELDASKLISILKLNSEQDVIDEFLQNITIHETYWFRDQAPWEALDEVLPALMDKIRKTKKRVQIWSAASSTGQEVYSTIIYIMEYIEKHNLKDINISHFVFYATDISINTIREAKKGTYHSFLMKRGFPEDKIDKYFDKDGDSYVLKDFVREFPHFAEYNILSNDKVLQDVDIVFVRNVLIYFNSVDKIRAAVNLLEQVAIGGTIILGAFDKVGYYKEYGVEKNKTENGFYYTKES